MKRLKIILLCMVVLAALNSCSDDDDKQPEFPVPEWSIDNAQQYPMSMSAVVTVPENIKVHASKNDKLAAFIGSECRGIAEGVDINGRTLYFILIKGSGAEQDKIKFMYYNIEKSRLYTTPVFLDFEVDSRYGSVDMPKILPLKIVNP